jgi:hypothetical protein
MVLSKTLQQLALLLGLLALVLLALSWANAAEIEGAQQAATAASVCAC